MVVSCGAALQGQNGSWSIRQYCQALLGRPSLLTILVATNDLKYTELPLVRMTKGSIEEKMSKLYVVEVPEIRIIKILVRAESAEEAASLVEAEEGECVQNEQPHPSRLEQGSTYVVGDWEAYEAFN